MNEYPDLNQVIDDDDLRDMVLNMCRAYGTGDFEEEYDVFAEYMEEMGIIIMGRQETALDV